MKIIFTLGIFFYFTMIALGQPAQMMIKMVNGKPQLVKVPKTLAPAAPNNKEAKTIASSANRLFAGTHTANIPSGNTNSSATQNPLLIKDINPNTTDGYSHSDPNTNLALYPDTGVYINNLGLMFFPARNYNGTELWQTDGTNAGTSISKDISSFSAYQDANPMFLQNIGNELFFFTADYDYNNNRFTTFRLRNRDSSTGYIPEGSLTDYPFDYVGHVMQANGYIFFLGINSDPNSYYNTNGDTALIKYDPVNNDYEVVNNNKPREIYAFNNYLIFDADDGTNGREPWAYDINNDYAYLLFDVNQGSGSSNPHDFITYHNSLYYTADDGSSGMQLKTVDASLSNFSGFILPSHVDPHNKIVFNDQLYFRTTDVGDNTYDVYNFNDADNGFNQVQGDNNPGNGAMVIANNHLFFAANDGQSGNQLWQTNGNNTNLVSGSPINNGGDANPTNFTTANNHLLFVVNDGSGQNIWTTNGSSASKLQSNNAGTTPTLFGTDNSFAYYFFDDGTHGKELWKTDGTQANTSLVKDINLGDDYSIGSNIYGMELFKGSMYFGAFNGSEWGLYKSNGTTAGTIEAVSGSTANFQGINGSPSQIKTVGNILFFSAYDNDHGSELWQTDSTQAGTRLVADINPGNNSSNPDNFTSVRGKLYFTADDGTNGTQLWVTDSTGAVPTLLKINVGNGNSPNIGNLTADTIHNKLFFTADNGSNGNELWVSNGTAAGTVMVKDINPGSDASNPGNLIMFNGKLFFYASNPTYGSEPWVSDGTTAGTTLLKDINPGPGSYYSFGFAPLGSYLYFGADSTGTAESVLWRTDGTTAGTHSFSGVPHFIFNMANTGNKITMIADGPNGFSMYSTDGSTAGTIKLPDFGTHGLGSFLFGNFATYKNHYFTWVTDNEHGNELWQTDGTAANTYVTDIAPGELSSYPNAAKGVAPFGPLLFSANDGTATGKELYGTNVYASVTWLNFTAKKYTDSSTLLQWATASEVNNIGFKVQRSTDNVTYTTISSVAPKSTKGASYSFIDSFPNNGLNYYRIQQLDNLGNSSGQQILLSYSNIETVLFYKPLIAGLIKGNDTLCTGAIPTIMTDSIPVTGGIAGTFTYQWQDSTAKTTWVNVVGATSATYQSPALPTTTYFRRKTLDYSDSSISNTLVKFYKTPPGDTSLAPLGAWNVYVYGGTDISLSNPANSPYYGYYSNTVQDYNTTLDWSNISNPTTASNYVGCPMDPSLVSAYGTFYTFTTALKRKGFAPGNYVLNLKTYTGSIRVLVNGVQFFDQNLPYTSASYSAPTVSLGPLDANAVVEIRMVTQPAYYYNALLNFAFFQSELKPGTITLTGNQSICKPQTPAPFASSQNGYGGPRPMSITYQWQDSTKGVAWVNIAGATAATYQPAVLSDTTYFRRAAGDGQSPIVYSDTVAINTITVTQTPVLTNVGRVLSINYIDGVQYYRWFRNGVLISDAYNSTYTATLAGTYTTKYTFQCGDGPASNAIVFAADAIAQNINFTQISNVTYSPTRFIKLNATAGSGLPIKYSVSGNAAVSNDTLYILGTGNITIVANQIGNTTYAPAPSVTQSFNVTQASQNINFSSIPNKKYGDTAFALNAASTSGLPIGYTIVSGPASINNGSYLTVTGVGTITVKASQTGNANYTAAADAQTSFCVGFGKLGAITGDTLVCPTAFKYATPFINGANYEWGVSGGGTVTYSGDTATVQWQTPGTYIVYAKGYSGCDATRSSPSNLVVTVEPVIVPGIVTNMFPADGATNQQLPLSLSWIPGSNNNSYDVYVWDTDSTQPATPYAANITAVNIILPNIGFKYNHAYKWRVVSNSGCSKISGPVQTFGLIPLADLVVSNIQVPATAFSGQPVSITWKVSNIGPGKTTLNQSWSDAVFLSFDSVPNFTVPPNTNPAAWSQLDFPVKPLLIGVRSNVSALDSNTSYTNSINFSLPANYSWPLYTYVITNYQPGQNAPLEMSKLNDTAHASPIIVTLSPTPDLRVDNVLSPNTVFSGSAVNVTYQVKNYGVVTPVNNSWLDKVYLSKSPFFDASTAISLKAVKANGTYYYNAPDAAFGHNAQLQQDSSYTYSVSVVMPNFISGTYFIYVVTDATNSVYEGSLENNNSGRSQVDILLTPTPNLIVSSLTLPATTVSTTQPFGVNWNIRNDGYYDNIQQNQGHYLATVSHCAACYVPYCPPSVATCTGCSIIRNCPPAVAGFTIRDSAAFGSSYWNDYVYLSTDSTQLDVNRAVLIGAFPHGTKPDGYTDYGNATSIPRLDPLGRLLAYGQYTSYYYASDQQGFVTTVPEGTNLRAFDVNVATAINRGSVFPGGLNFNLPDNLPQGKYYVYVFANADSSVYEFPSQHQIARSGAINVVRPDLAVNTVSVPATGSAGQSINISYTISNVGAGGLFSHSRTDRIYMSTSAVFDANAQLVASPAYTESVPAGGQATHQVSYTLPIDASGTRYFYISTNLDSSFKETNYANNISTNTAAISISAAQTPDLYVSSFTVPNVVTSVLGSPIKYTVPNQGVSATVGTWVDSIYVSCSPTFDYSTAYGVASRFHNEVVPVGGSYTDSFNLVIPYTFDISGCFGQGNAQGYFFVKSNAKGFYESTGSSNNVLGTGVKTIVNPLVDQIVTTVSGTDSAVVGRNYNLSWTVKNIGYNPGYASYSAWYDAIYFSTDSVFNNNAVYAGNLYENNPIATNQTYTSTANVVTPKMGAGNYYVFVNTNYYNSIHGERDLTNNTNLIRDAAGKAQTVRVVAPLLPDLTDSILISQTTTPIGQPLSVIYQVSNNGPGATYPSTWSDDFWLSADFVPGNAGDIYLGSYNHSGALQPGEKYTNAINLAINMNVPPGNYVLIAKTNTNNGVFETNTANNLAFQYITVYSPAPSDLMVSNITHPDTAYLGLPDTTVWNLNNISPNPAKGTETDGVYLSKSSTLDSTAILLGVKSNMLNLLPLTLDTLSLSPLLQGVPEGIYYMIVKTDILNNIVESNKDNNATAAAKQIYVKVKELPLNILTPATLGNTSLYYKLVIPTSMRGATILVTLTTPDSIKVNNQMYIGLGYVPTAARFDFAFSTPNAGNQQILMPSVMDSVYYITMTCTTPNAAVQHISLLAQNLPFSIIAVNSNQGGNTGNVTVKISGSLFSTGMQAVLSKSGTTIYASAIYYVNSTSVYATFNLQAQPLGLYDVSLIKADASTTVSPQSFSVVAANNGGLITGGATNSGQSGSGNSPGCDPGATSGLNAQLQTQIVIPPKVFAGWPFTIQINYSNPTNVDISAQTRILYSLNGLPVSLTADGVATAGTTLYLQFTEQNGPPNIIRAGATGTITIYSKAPADYPGHKLANFNLK